MFQFVPEVAIKTREGINIKPNSLFKIYTQFNGNIINCLSYTQWALREWVICFDFVICSATKIKAIVKQKEEAELCRIK